MKKIKTMKLLKNGTIRFGVNNVKFNDDIAIHLLASEMCERLTRKFKRIISTNDVSINKSYLNDNNDRDYNDHYISKYTFVFSWLQIIHSNLIAPARLLS